jgi:hypothetical protein
VGGIWVSDYEGRAYFALGFEVADERDRSGGFVVNAVLLSGERIFIAVEDTEAEAFKRLASIADDVKAIRV